MIVFLSWLAVPAQAEQTSLSYEQFFLRHSATMMLIDPDTGGILDANNAAADFYGFDRDTLRSMSIQNINQLTAEQVEGYDTVALAGGEDLVPALTPDGAGGWTGETRTETVEPIGQWVSFVDASTGELLNVYNEVRFLSGTIDAEHGLLCDESRRIIEAHTGRTLPEHQSFDWSVVFGP